MYQVCQLEENASDSLNLQCLDLKSKVKCYNEYFVNKNTYKNEVYVKGSTSNESKVEYYEKLE